MRSEPLIPNIPGLRRDLLAMGLLATTSTFAMGLLTPILPMHLDAIGIDARTIGLLFSVAAVATAIGEFSWGWAIDRVHLRLPMAVGTAGLACVLLAFACTRSVPLLFTLFFLRGVTFVGTVPASRGFVGSTMAAHQKALFLALYTTTLGIGRTLGSFSGGLIAKEWGYVAAFIACSAIVLGISAIGLPLLRASRLTHYAYQMVSLPGWQVQHQARSGPADTASYKAQGLIAMLTFVPVGVALTFIPLLAKKVLLLQPSDVGMIFAISGLVSIFFTVPMGRLSDRYGRRPFMATGLAIVGASLIGMSFAGNAQTLLLFMMLNAFGTAIFSPSAVALLSDSAPPGKQGVAMGLYGLCEDVGIIVGPAIGGVLWEGLGPAPTFWFGGTPTFLAAVIALTAIRRRAPETAIATR